MCQVQDIRYIIAASNNTDYSFMSDAGLDNYYWYINIHLLVSQWIPP